MRPLVTILAVVGGLGLGIFTTYMGGVDYGHRCDQTALALMFSHTVALGAGFAVYPCPLWGEGGTK